MFLPVLAAAAVFVILTILLMASCFRVLKQDELGVLFRLGRVIPRPITPGLLIVMPFADRLVRIPAGTQTVEIAPNASLTFRVVDPIKAATEVEDYRAALLLGARQGLEILLANATPDQLRFETQHLRETFSRSLSTLAAPFGVEILKVEIDFRRSANLH